MIKPQPVSINPEFAMAIGYAGNICRLAKLIGVSRGTLKNQREKGFMSKMTAERVHEAYPQLDEDRLMEPLAS